MEAMLNVWAKMGAPPALSKDLMDKWTDQPDDMPTNNQLLTAPLPSFTEARVDRHGKRMPQVIAHRGYKAKYPENSMLAMESAVEIGVQGLETDVHLSQDGVVVLSHDKTLQRCFGVDKSIIDCEWKYLSQLRTTREPHVPMPKLEDLLRYLATPGLEKIWLLLDIKIDNDPETIMRRMAETISQVEPAAGTQWEDRVVLGCWATKYLPYCQKYFPRFPITIISISTSYSKQFFKVPNVSFNMFFPVLVTPCGKRFIRAAQRRGRPVYAWTVNDVNKMDWCIRQRLDGVITDDPKKFLDLSGHFDHESKAPGLTLMEIINYTRINIFVWLFAVMFFYRRLDRNSKPAR